MESENDIYMDYLRHDVLDKDDWDELNKNNVNTFASYLTQSGVLPPIYFSNTTSTNHETKEHIEKSLGIDFAFFALFVGVPIGVSAIAGLISGGAISRSDSCLACITGITIISNTDFLSIRPLLPQQIQPNLDQDVVNYFISTTPKIMKGITALTIAGFSIGSLWYGSENKVSLSQQIVTLISEIVITPIIFNAAEGYTMNAAR